MAAWRGSTWPWSAYRDWAGFETATGQRLVTTTGGLVFCPADGPYSAADFTASLTAFEVPHELLDAAEVTARWPQFRIPRNVQTVYTPDSGIVHASRSVAAFQMQARAGGAVVRDHSPVSGLSPGGSGVTVHTETGEVHARKVILTVDAWSNYLLKPLGAEIPLVTMQEQVTYFRPADPGAFDRDRFPVWIWQDTRCFYGFPTYGEPAIKAARDVSNNLMAPEERDFVPSDELVAELSSFMGGLIPGTGRALRTITCQYALTPDRQFMIGPLPKQPDIIVALGAGHAFKFAPAIGRILAELAVDGETTDAISTFAVST